MISIFKMNQLPGRFSSPSLIISSIILAIIVCFYIYSAGTFIEVSVYPLVHRENNQESFNRSLIEDGIDKMIIVSCTILWLALSLQGKLRIMVPPVYGIILVISVIANQDFILDGLFLISLPLITSLIIMYHVFHRRITSPSSILPLNYLAIFGIGISIISIGFTVLISANPSAQVHDISYEIFLLLSSICPIMILVLTIYSPIRLLILKYKNSTVGTDSDNNLNSSSLGIRTKFLIIMSFMLLSVVIVLISHNTMYNSQIIGSDTVDYVKTLDSLKNANNSSDYLHGIFVQYFGGDRPISLLFLAALTKIIPLDSTYSVDHASLILAPLIVLVTYFLTRELTSDEGTALFSAFLTAVSFQTLIGLFSGIYANWIALIFGYLCLTFFVKFAKNPTKLNIIFFSSLLILTLFSHVYTWTILTIFMFILLPIAYKLNHYQKKKLFVLALILTGSVIVDFARTEITGHPGGIEEDVRLANSEGAGTQQLGQIWSNLTLTVLNYSGGMYGSFPMLALALFWIFRCTKRNLSSTFLLVFLSIGLLPLFFGSTVLQTRVLYDIPFQIPAAIALATISQKYKNNLIAVSVCVWIFAMSIKAVTNFSHL